MSGALLRHALVWGAVLWLFGYLLSFAFFFFVPTDVLGWAVMPFALTLTIWVAVRRVDGPTLAYYTAVGLAWAILAVVLDYFLLVRLLKPADGYYKLDVYLYYAFTFLVPPAAGWWKLRSASER
ncbi:MAG TPA: hypothetical protein VMU01_04850 [Rhizomicrobium sp.]|nr:hypothetical protein [Rhizomicrobium sp.]